MDVLTDGHKAAAKTDPQASTREFDACLTLTVALNLYPLSALQRAAYLFTDKAFVLLEEVGDAAVRVSIRRKDGSSDLKALQGEFANALLDFALRDQIEQQTAGIRDQLVTAALAPFQRLNHG